MPWVRHGSSLKPLTALSARFASCLLCFAVDIFGPYPDDAAHLAECRRSFVDPLGLRASSHHIRGHSDSHVVEATVRDVVPSRQDHSVVSSTSSRLHVMYTFMPIYGGIVLESCQFFCGTNASGSSFGHSRNFYMGDRNTL